MSWLRPLGKTGLHVSALGLGTVKLGRNTNVKYPHHFALPNDAQAQALLEHAQQLGINLLDTAPAYGNSEERLGQLLAGQRDQWIISTKAGETYSNGHSHFDFHSDAITTSVERSLRRLRTDALDLVLLHSNGDDLNIIDNTGALEALAALKSRGDIRAYGMSTKTSEGALAAVDYCDVIMVTRNIEDRQAEDAIAASQRKGVGVLLKKVLGSGYHTDSSTRSTTGGGNDPTLETAWRLALSVTGVSSALVGTLSLTHLAENANIVRSLCE